jgi:signal transduction histidine kinase
MDENGLRAGTGSQIPIWSCLRELLVCQGQRLHIGSIRVRLLLAFVLMAMLSAAGISSGSAIVGYLNGRRQVEDRLDSVAALKALSIKAWADTLQTGLLTVSSDQFASQRVSVVLGLAKLGKQYIWYDDSLRVRLRTFVEESSQFEELCLVDVRGVAVLCSGSSQTTDDCHAEPFFQKGLTSSFTEIILSSYGQEAHNHGVPTDTPGQAAQASRCSILSPATRTPFAIVARPVISSEGESLGVIVGRASSQGLTEILAERTGLGRTGEAYLVSPSFELLPTHSGASPNDRTSTNLRRSLGVASAMRDRSEESGIYEDYQGKRVLGTYHWLPDLQIVLAVEQGVSEAFSGILQGLAVSLSIAVVVALVAVVVSIRITRSITHPLVSLVETAKQIAGGNLERTASVVRDDEIGVLATTFNSMTAQLRDLIGHLEQRVRMRTRALHEANEALQRRALQMETSATVSREITSILEIDELLTHVVRLIRDAFGYSHARIFLLDGTELVQRSSTSRTVTGVRRLHVDLISLNTEAVRTRQVVVVNDVAHDPRFLKEEPLPDTRSEVAIPLRVGDQVTGTLNVLSDKFNAFTPEDLLVLQSLGDQIAVAIENARLYARSRDLAVLEERNRLARDLHDSATQSLYSLTLLFEGWRQLLRSGQSIDVEEIFDRAAAIAQQALREMRLMVYELRPTALEDNGLLGALRQRLDAVERSVGVKTRLIAADLLDLPAPVQECLQHSPMSPATVSPCRDGAARGYRSCMLGSALYYIALEALNNALKHSGANEVILRFYTQDDQVVLQVTDDGHGFAPAPSEGRSGMGLMNMRQRAQEMGGALIIESAPGKATTVTARVRCAALTASQVKSL